MTLQYERGLVGMGFNPSIYPLRYALPDGPPLSAHTNASEKHTSGVKTPFPEYRRVAGDESPAYRSRHDGNGDVSHEFALRRHREVSRPAIY